MQLSDPSQTAGISVYNKDIFDNFIGSQQCRALGHGPIDRWFSPPLMPTIESLVVWMTDDEECEILINYYPCQYD